jgi:hypothetical protein
MKVYQCCPHCVEDQPHIQKDTHTLPCDVCEQESEVGRLRAENAVLQASIDRVQALAADWKAKAVAPWHRDASHTLSAVLSQSVKGHHE